MAWTSAAVRLVAVGPGRPSAQSVGDRHAEPAGDYMARALELWPRLDREKVRRARADPRRLAHLVERRTGESFEVILSMLDPR